jgi:hypothetical protein
MCSFRVIALVCVACSITACADLTSIGRSRTLPSSTTVDGRALHLDAKQRVVIAKAGTRDNPDMVCAEPSPDALSAFASSLSGGISVSGEGAGSAAGALSEAAASIGLRTQSITLMRDALYRVCEAYYNGQLSRPQVMALISRSQDLTAAVVAVEQLTGAVVAQQAALGGSASGSSSATMLSNAQALAAARELETKYQQELADLKIQQAADQKAVNDKRTEIANKQAEIDHAADADKAGLTAEKEKLEKEDLPPLEDALKDSDTRVQLKQDQLNDISKARAAIEQQLDSSVTTASATAAGNARLSGGSTVYRIDKDTATAISTAVTGITADVLNKSYVVEECMALLTTPGVDLGEFKAAITDSCLTAIEARAAADAAASRAAEARANNAVDRALLPPTN